MSIHRGMFTVIAALCSVGALAMACLPARASEPPLIVRESVSEVRYSTANLEAEINAYELNTIYHFEYGLDSTYGTSVTVPTESITASSSVGASLMHVGLDGLQPGREYHYRVVATNAAGTQYGADKTFMTFAQPSPAGPDICPNAAFRAGFSAALPDCRAYEMVSPVDKNGGYVPPMRRRQVVASNSGERVEYVTRTGMGETNGSGAGGFSQFLASRGPDGWSSKGILPTPSPSNPIQLGISGLELTGEIVAEAFSGELNRAVITGYALPGVEGAIPKGENLYLENLPGRDLTAMTTPEIPGEKLEPSNRQWPVGHSADLDVTLFESSENLVPGAKHSQVKLYEFNHGTLELVGVMPDGSIATGDVVSPRYDCGGGPCSGQRKGLRYDDTVSRDGSRVYFMTPKPPGGQLYLRREGKTVWVSEPETPGPAFEPHEVSFQAATPDGRKVLFTSKEPLLSVDPGGEGLGLYMYTDSPNPQSEPNLTFISRAAVPNVLGVSEDASHIYFQSHAGYSLWDEGQVKHVAPEPGASLRVGAPEEARISHDGSIFAFTSREAATSRETPLGSGVGKVDQSAEMYVYNARSETLRCASCSPSGAAPRMGIELNPPFGTNPEFEVLGRRQFLSADGRYVFFSTADALLPQDTNGVTDVYEYDTQTDTLSLLSTGSSEDEAWFLEASPSGDDVFISTGARLTGWDPDKLDDLYDVRVDGGFPEPSPPPVPCEGDECQGVPSAAPDFSTASGFVGLGNQAPVGSKAVKARRLGSARRLRVALRACARKPRRERARCRARARRRLAAKSTVKGAPRRPGR